MTASEELDAWVVKCLMHQPWMGEMVRAAIANTQRVIPDHVSAAGVCKPKQDVRVLLSRRSGHD